MQSSQKKNGTITVVADTYSLTVAHDRPFIYLQNAPILSTDAMTRPQSVRGRSRRRGARLASY